jgi:glycine cleavage system aminomethyltransferase T
VVRCDPYGFPGYRLHVASEMLRHVFLALGDLPMIGARALESLRLDSGTPSWPSELNAEVTPQDVQRATGAARHLVHLEIDGADTMPHGNEPVRDASGRIVGRTTSAGWGYQSGRALAFALVEPAATGLGICVMGGWHKARPTGGNSGVQGRHIQEKETA